MIYNIKSIKTKYNGYVYRSRLEAQWAAFFDRCKWRYDYEPFDLNGWVPDFEIHTSRNRKLLVEVKPVSFQDSKNADNLVANYYDKALNHVHSFDLLLLGQSPFKYEGICHIGVFCETKYILESEVAAYISLGCGKNDDDLYFHQDFAAFKCDGVNYGLSPYYGIWDDIFNKAHRKRFDEIHDQCLYLFRDAANIIKEENPYKKRGI